MSNNKKLEPKDDYHETEKYKNKLAGYLGLKLHRPWEWHKAHQIIHEYEVTESLIEEFDKQYEKELQKDESHDQK